MATAKFLQRKAILNHSVSVKMPVLYLCQKEVRQQTTNLFTYNF